MYMKGKKHAQWGPKLWVLAEGGTGYTYRVEIYKGKRWNNVANYPHGLGYEVVMKLMEGHLHKGYHVITDR